MPHLTSEVPVKPATEAALRRGSLAAALALWAILLWMTWYRAPDWSYQPDVTAPLTRKLLFFHPPAAWTSFVAYFLVFAFGVAYLNEWQLRYDAPARAAAEVGFGMNTIALVTGTFWGVQEWSDTGRSALATVYSEPKVLVVLVLWLTFAAYLMLRRVTDGPERQARLAAAFGVLGFIGVPLSFATSRVLQTSKHPDIAGPGKNPDAAVSGDVGTILLVGFLAFLALFLHLWLQRLRLLRLEERIDAMEET